MTGTGSAAKVTRIIRAADELVRRIIAWLQDPHGGPVVPAGVANQLHAVNVVFNEVGTCPDSCQSLQTAASRLAEEYRGYTEREHGKVRPENGAPGPGFWAAVKALARARVGADQPLVERIEPVSVLLKQGVSHAQIGQRIYGRRGVGPFIQQNGDVDVGLIEQEGREPGSVIPANWIPPWHNEAIERRRRVLEEQLALFSKMETAKKYDDPATVEELLREGAFVQQIERAKGVTRDEVLEAARRIGVEAVDGPAYRSAVFSPPNATDDSDRPATAAMSADLKERIIAEFAAGEGQVGAAEIAEKLRKEGHDVNTQKVSATIGHWKKRQAQAEAAGTV